jgi:predicted ATPase
LQVATEVLTDFPDGVFLVSLAPISDPELVVSAIAQVLDVIESGARPLQDLLTAFLKEKHLLLCLDNFEQILPAAPYLTDLLVQCPHLNMLVTSRAVLHIQGEHEFLVPPLAVPDLTKLPPDEILPDYAAIALFLQRAEAVQPTFQMTSSNARTIAEICVHLDGLPLAIELAAARSKLLSPQALLARLSQRFAILTSGARDAPMRQQTLRNTIEWSYHLLDAAEQRLFRQIAVFVGGCNLEAIEAISAALEGNQVEGQILEGVAFLIDKSLLHKTEQEGEQSRLVMLETIREYGLECLKASAAMEITLQAHANYFLALAERAEPELVGPQQTIWLERLEQEHHNLRAAMQWSLEQREDGYRGEMALRLGGVLRRFWLMHNHWSEGRELLERALAGSNRVAASVRAKALIAGANLANMQADNDRAEALAKESLTLCRELGDTQGIALSLRLLGVAAARRRNYTAARSLNEEALVLFREVGDKEGAAWSLMNLADLFIHEGDYARGRVLFEESLALHRELGNKWGMADSLQMLAKALFESMEDQSIVRALLEEGLALSREVGDKHGIASYFVLSGRLALSQGDAATARSRAEESLTLNREFGKRE